MPNTIAIPKIDNLKEPEKPYLRKGKILIIEDTVENIFILGNILRKESYDVLTATDPLKGIAIAESKLPDIILLDVMMPKMNGYEVCNVLKQNASTANIPIIFLTSLNDQASKIKGFNYGASDYVSKPFEKLELLARIKNHIHTKLSVEQNRTLFDSVHHTYITINKELKIINYNKTANLREEYFHNRELNIGDSIFDFITVEEHALFRRKLTTVFEGKISTMDKEYIINGVSHWYKFYFEPIFSHEGEVVGCLINGTDITEKKGFELRVQDKNSKLKEAIIDTKESLEYASYIQNAIFPSNAEFAPFFKDFFILYKPKDIVSGDFYWLYPFENKVIFVLGDCTGHGVSGALLSMIGVLILERIIKYNGVASPDAILHEIDENLKNTLRRKVDRIESGMELAVCLFDLENKTVQYAGAKRSMLMSTKSGLIEIPGCRYELGGSIVKSFKQKTLKYDSSTSFYLYSDGITDQLGGQKAKRFMKKNLLELLEANQNEKMYTQKEIIEKALQEWMINETQTDDISLIGLIPN